MRHLTTLAALTFALSLTACTSAVSVATCDSALQRPDRAEPDPQEAPEVEEPEDAESR